MFMIFLEEWLFFSIINTSCKAEINGVQIDIVEFLFTVNILSKIVIEMLKLFTLSKS